MTRSAAALLTVLAACGPTPPDVALPDGGGDDAGVDAPTLFTDFPARPLIGPGLPADLGDHFGPSAGGGGPCLVEPSLGALVPANFPSPLWQWLPAADTDPSVPARGVEVVELRLHVDNQARDLVAYYTGSELTIPEPIWEAVRQHSAGHRVEVTLRSALVDGGVVVRGPLDGSRGAITLAPVEAPGAIVYWTTSGDSALKGFTVGDRGVVTVLTPEMMGLPRGHCIGCHTSTPDGAWAVTTHAGPTSGGNGFAVDVRGVDGTGRRATADVATPFALGLLGRGNQTMPTLSPARFGPAASMVVSVLETSWDPDDLVFTDLRATSGGTGTLRRDGDRRSAGTPAFSHDGTRVAYTSADVIADGYPLEGESDLAVIPFADGAGGTSTPLAGASTPGVAEYYPAFSPDDHLIAFDRSRNLRAYHEPSAEVMVVSSSGGVPVRLAANDPPACSGVRSPGVTNSWPKWAPDVELDGDDRYYWLTFSSTRRAGIPQLYVAGLRARLSGGALSIAESYPAVYVPNQPRDEHNHTPAWDRFQVVVP